MRPAETNRRGLRVLRGACPSHTANGQLVGNVPLSPLSREPIVQFYRQVEVKTHSVGDTTPFRVLLPISFICIHWQAVLRRGRVAHYLDSVMSFFSAC